MADSYRPTPPTPPTPPPPYALSNTPPYILRLSPVSSPPWYPHPQIPLGTLEDELYLLLRRRRFLEIVEKQRILAVWTIFYVLVFGISTLVMSVVQLRLNLVRNPAFL